MSLSSGLSIGKKTVTAPSHKPVVNRRTSVASGGLASGRNSGGPKKPSARAHTRTKSHGVAGAAGNPSSELNSGRSVTSESSTARRKSVDLLRAASSARPGSVGLNPQTVRAAAKVHALKRATNSALSREEQLQKKIEKRAKEIAAEKERERRRKTELRSKLLQQRRDLEGKSRQKQRELEEKQRRDMEERARMAAAEEADRKKSIAEAERLRKMQIKQKKTETLNKRKTERLTRAVEKKVAEAQRQRQCELDEHRRHEKELAAKRHADVLRQKNLLHEKEERERRERDEDERHVYEAAMAKEQQLAEQKRRDGEERAQVEAIHLEQQRVNREADQLIRVGKVTAIELADQKLMTTHFDVEQNSSVMPRAPGDDDEDEEADPSIHVDVQSRN